MSVKAVQAVWRTEVFAHRGWSAKYPENTMAAFLAALELGVDGLEFDVHLSRDGQVMVIHDSDVARTTNGHGSVEDLTYEELRQLDAGSWFDLNFAGQVIPTLDEVLALVSLQGKPVTLNIELKASQRASHKLGERVWKKVCAHGLMNRCIISSFNHFILRDLKRRHPVTAIAVLYGEGLVEPWRYATFLGAEGLHPHYQWFDEAVVRESHAMGTSIRPYTVNDHQTMEEFLVWGVDAVITDHPDLLLALRDAHANATV